MLKTRNFYLAGCWYKFSLFVFEKSNMQINSGKDFFNDVFIRGKEEIKVQIKIPPLLEMSLRKSLRYITMYYKVIPIES